MGTSPLGKNQPQINFDKKELNILYNNFMSMDSNKNKWGIRPTLFISHHNVDIRPVPATLSPYSVLSFWRMFGVILFP